MATLEDGLVHSHMVALLYSFRASVVTDMESFPLRNWP